MPFTRNPSNLFRCNFSCLIYNDTGRFLAISWWPVIWRHNEGSYLTLFSFIWQKCVESISMTRYMVGIVSAKLLDEVTIIRVCVLLYELTLAAVSCSPKHNLQEDQYESFFLTLESKFIEEGDFNSKNMAWGSRLSTTQVAELTRVFITRMKFLLLINRHTHELVNRYKQKAGSFGLF